MLTLKNATNVINAAIEHAQSIGAAPLGVVVLDLGGHMVAYKRQDGAAPLRFDIARGKARGAILMGMSSRKFADMAIQRPVFVSGLSTLTEGDIVPSAGGILLRESGGDKIVGAVGISGDAPDVDEDCAIVGAKNAGFGVLHG